MKRARGTAPPSTFNKDLLINLALGVGFLDAISLGAPEESKEECAGEETPKAKFISKSLLNVLGGRFLKRVSSAMPPSLLIS